MEVKNQENEHYIDTLRETNTKLNEKIAKLEEGIGNIEERRLSLERHTNLLGATLQEKTSEFQKNEDELLSRLQALSEHDETIEKRLAQIDLEKQQLIDSLKDANNEKNGLAKKLQLIESQMSDLQNTQLVDLENDNVSLVEKNNALQLELKRLSSEFEKKMEEQQNAVVDLENDLISQMQRMGDERRDLQHNLEKTKDKNSELNCDIVRFKEIITSLEQSNSDLEREMTWIKMQNENMNQDHIENQELRMQIVHDQTEIENLKEQTEALQQNHEREVAALKQQIVELDSLRAQIGQNQTDDQVFIQNENERLQALLTSKDLEIQNFQRQNLQLQMSLSSAATVDPFFEISAGQSAQQSGSIDSDEQLILNKKIDELNAKLQSALGEVSALQASNSELINQCSHKDANIVSLQDYAKDQLNALAEENKLLKVADTQKDTEISSLRDENAKLSDATTKSISQTKVDQMQATIQQLEQYIADLQIQLRISTNDCEQTAQTIQSLEDEIRNRTSKYEGDLASLRQELEGALAQQDLLKQQQQQQHSQQSPVQPQEEPILKKAFSGATAAEPPQYFADIEKMIIPNADVPSAEKQASELPSFNSSMFFGSTQPTAFDDAFSSAPPNQSNRQHDQPVVEPIIIPKKAYVCQPDNAQSDMGSVPDSVITQVPVVEEVCVAKQAYLCHPEESEEITLQDDGWGFGSDEAALEEQHQQQTGYATKTSLVPEHLGQALQDYENSIQELQAERDTLREEKKALQLQSAKMLKKLKDYKAKNEQLSTAQYFQKSPSVESNDLDLAIQEELNNQVKMLENRLKEVKTELEKENAEKQNLQKRVDVLASANDTMVDMKQRQDSEMEMCKSRMRQMSQKISQLEEWSEDNEEKVADDGKGGTVPASDANSAKQIEMLSKQVNDARMDCDEIQALLDEEKEHSIVLEERIKKLQESLLGKEETEEANRELAKKVEKFSNENSFLRNEVACKTEAVGQLEAKVTKLKEQISESIATIDVLSNESNNIRIHLDQLKEEHRHKINENNNLSKELSLLSEKNQELSTDVTQMKSSGIFSDESQANGKEFKEMEDRIQELTATIQYKDGEIAHLNQKVADVIREDQTQSLIQEILNKNFEINNLRAEVKQLSDARVELENNLSIQLTKEIQSVKPAVETSELEKLQKQVTELVTEKVQMENELQVLNDQVLSSLELEDKMKSTVLELDMKNIEIHELKNSLELMKQHSNPGADSNQIDETVTVLNGQWEQVLEQRCGEVAESWRQHLQQRESEFSLTETSLRQEIDLMKQALKQSTSSSETIDKYPEPSHDDHNQPQQSTDADLISKMQEALENQEIEIVTLKEQLAIRSAEYARIVSKVDPFGQMSHTSSMMTMDLKAKKSSESLESSSAGQKSELDLALYMLHQRDMRCEDLTEELIHLLEERDTLQLKLSNALRQNEDIRAKTGYVDASSESVSADASPERPPSNRSSVSIPADGIGAENNLQSNFNLNAKISQLQNVSHSRDKTLREEREQRQRQMALLQQDVATLPPEAVAELIGADYTLSRQSQSPSAVLLNWLWGKSTPKSPDTN